MTESTLTIGRLARAAAVNVETVRYYQARKLLPIPNRG
jgi:DNA-binding transcriptional MerR regulator